MHYNSIIKKQTEIRKKKTNHTCSHSQMVASHFIRGHPQPSILHERNHLPRHPHWWNFICSWVWLYPCLEILLLISLGYRKTQAICCIACVLRLQIRHRRPWNRKHKNPRFSLFQRKQRIFIFAKRLFTSFLLEILHTLEWWLDLL